MPRREKTHGRIVRSRHGCVTLVKHTRPCPERPWVRELATAGFEMLIERCLALGLAQLNHRLRGFDLVSELQKLRFRGGGGTSFVEPIEAALATNPSAIVVLTDLYGPFGDAPGRIPVFWVCPQTNPKPPPFGGVVPVFG